MKKPHHPRLVSSPALFAVLMACAVIQAPPRLHAQVPDASQTPALLSRTEDGFSVPQPGAELRFPRDHGSHPDFKVEWWYLTGHLYGPQQERFGFQATFFRRAVATPAPQPRDNPRFRTDEIHLFHAALLDTRTGQFLHTEQIARAGWNAEAATDKLKVRLGDALLEMTDPAKERMRLKARIEGDASFELELDPAKPLVRFGKDGISRKGNSPTAASYYLTFPRLKASGELVLGAQRLPVKGQVWMDHEISSSQLTGEQAGWDWTGIQLEDGREIMTYRLRLKNGTTDPASELTWVDASGKTTAFGAGQFRWEALGEWRSPRSGARYPLPVRLSTTDPATGRPVELRLEPLQNNQELEGSITGLPYWEGACRVTQDGKPVGSAYVELTGYAGELTRALK